MAEEQAGLGIQRGDGRHLLITQREVEYIDLPWVSPIFAKVGLSNMPDRPSSNGAHASYE